MDDKVFGYDDSERERTTRTVKLGPPDPRAENTTRHLSKGWLPVHPTILNEAKQITQGKSGIDRVLLIAKVKKDPGLFLFCARSMKQIVTKGVGQIDLFESLRTLEEEKLQALFSVAEKDISSHKMSESTRAQALRLQFSLVATKTAEALAKRASLSEETAFSAASFRQLGLNLIAWNYPRIYARLALRPQTDTTEFDNEIRKVLGLTPLQVGARFAASWETHPQVKALLTTTRTAAQPNEGESTERTMDLSRILEISELFAKRRDPKHFPDAEILWRKEQESLTKLFSPEVFSEIDDTIKETLTLYSKVTDSVFSIPLGPDRDVHNPEYASKQAHLLASKNRSLSKCRVATQIEFLRVYEKVKEGKVSEEALKILVNLALPRVGVARGCLFLLAPNERTLIPALRIGDRPLAEYGDFLKEPDNGVQASPYNSAPFVGEGIGITGRIVRHVCASLDSSRKLGVIYFELTEERANIPTPEITMLFKAARVTLHHCLGMT